LHFIKTHLGTGNIIKDGTKARVAVRDRKKLEAVIFPIFDKDPLLTSKHFNYVILKKSVFYFN
jgi:hypothetical protein